jgi:hypothetical protein
MDVLMIEHPKFVLTPRSTWKRCKCGAYVPAFDYLDPELQKRIDKRSRLWAIRELTAVGCDHSTAKIWAMHPNGADGEFIEVLCPYCGKPLRTVKAKQCRWCLRDWHSLA